MRKGFSLVELLAVLIILGVLAAIIIPSVQTSINSSKNDLYDVVVSEIKSGARQYIMKNPSLVADLSVGESIYVDVTTLVSAGILDDSVENPKTGSAFGNGARVKVTKPATGNYVYDFENPL